MKYSSERYFKLWAYTVSHSSLLLRSPKLYIDQEGYNDSNNYNIDIEIWDVRYIDLLSHLGGLVLEEVLKKDAPDKFKWVESARGSVKIFQIQSQQNFYHIVAGGLIIGKNYWDNQDRITCYSSNLEHDKIIIRC